MFQRPLRLGDSIDDYCSRCRFLSNHVVVSLVDNQPQKVRCQTCQTEHDYRFGKGGRPKKSEVKVLVDKMLEGMPPPRQAPPPKPVKPAFPRNIIPKKK